MENRMHMQSRKKWVNEALEYLSGIAEIARDQEVFRPLCVEFAPYGVHFIDKIFGANVFWDDVSEQWYNDHIDTPIGELEYPDLSISETWTLARTVAEEFVRSKVRLPLFGLPVIASALNIAVNLYGEGILVAMHMEPSRAKRDLGIINRLLVDLHQWYRECIPYEQLQPVVSAHRTQPPGCGQLCGCTTQLISPAMYEEFIAPLDDELLSVYPKGGMIHLCGSHMQHLPIWGHMKSVRAIQLNDQAAADLEVYFRELREDQLIYLNPFDGMTAEQALSITSGKRLVIVGEFALSKIDGDKLGNTC